MPLGDVEPEPTPPGIPAKHIEESRYHSLYDFEREED